MCSSARRSDVTKAAQLCVIGMAAPTWLGLGLGLGLGLVAGWPPVLALTRSPLLLALALTLSALLTNPRT